MARTVEEIEAEVLAVSAKRGEARAEEIRLSVQHQALCEELSAACGEEQAKRMPDDWESQLIACAKRAMGEVDEAGDEGSDSFEVAGWTFSITAYFEGGGDEEQD